MAAEEMGRLDLSQVESSRSLKRTVMECTKEQEARQLSRGPPRRTGSVRPSENPG